MSDAKELPEGMTCGDCAHWSRCLGLISTLSPDGKRCDFNPSRFVKTDYSPDEEYIHKLESDLARERALVKKLRADTAPAVKECREAREILTADGWDMGSGWDLPGAAAALIAHRDGLLSDLEAKGRAYRGAVLEGEKLERERDELRHRLRVTAQIIIEEIGADGPQNAEEAARNIVGAVQALRRNLDDERAGVVYRPRFPRGEG